MFWHDVKILIGGIVIGVLISWNWFFQGKMIHNYRFKKPT